MIRLDVLHDLIKVELADHQPAHRPARSDAVDVVAQLAGETEGPVDCA